MVFTGFHPVLAWYHYPVMVTLDRQNTDRMAKFLTWIRMLRMNRA